MRPAWTVAALFVLAAVPAGQATGVLRVKVTLLDEAKALMPVARHALLVSDNPATREPRRILTSADGTAALTLPPGSYTVESDRAVAFLGQAYQWTQTVDVAAGRDTTLELTAGNAEVAPLPASPSGPGAPARDELFPVANWVPSVVEIWSPTARASGFVIDARGLIATDRNAVGAATSVEVQVSPTVKVPARVLSPDGTRDVAIVWVHPSVVSAAAPVPLSCPPAPAPTLDDGQEIATIGAPFGRAKDQLSGEVTALAARAAETDLRLPFGAAGGPVFNAAGAVVGLTSLRDDPDPRRAGSVAIVRVSFICAALSSAVPQTAGGAPPAPTALPVEPAHNGQEPRASPREEPRGNPPEEPPVVSSSDFDVTFITPAALARAQQKSDWTGGRSTRTAEAIARLGRVTDFGGWSQYFARAPSVLIVRVTPKLVEGFWKRLAREAARTQGAELPPFKDFTTSFLRMTAACGGPPLRDGYGGQADVTPIHPFVLEHRVSEKNVVREGLYVFDPAAFGPPCTSLTLSLYSEKSPAKAETITAPQPLIDRIRQDFASPRTPG
jgi:S1-C subfamily serine protease